MRSKPPPGVHRWHGTPRLAPSPLENKPEIVDPIIISLIASAEKPPKPSIPLSDSWSRGGESHGSSYAPAMARRGLPALSDQTATCAKSKLTKKFPELLTCRGRYLPMGPQSRLRGQGTFHTFAWS